MPDSASPRILLLQGTLARHVLCGVHCIVSHRGLCCLCTQPTVKLLINGEFRESEATEWVDVTNPVRMQLFTATC